MAVMWAYFINDDEAVARAAALRVDREVQFVSYDIYLKEPVTGEVHVYRDI